MFEESALEYLLPVFMHQVFFHVRLLSQKIVSDVPVKSTQIFKEVLSSYWIFKATKVYVFVILGCI